jgi:hypothetical protein
MSCRSPQRTMTTPAQLLSSQSPSHNASLQPFPVARTNDTSRRAHDGQCEGDGDVFSPFGCVDCHRPVKSRSRSLASCSPWRRESGLSIIASNTLTSVHCRPFCSSFHSLVRCSSSISWLHCSPTRLMASDTRSNNATSGGGWMELTTVEDGGEVGEATQEWAIERHSTS